MTKDEILKIKEHIEIHARREHRAIIITEILWKAVDELEHIKELKKENEQLKAQIEEMKNCYNCSNFCDRNVDCSSICVRNNPTVKQLKDYWKMKDIY